MKAENKHKKEAVPVSFENNAHFDKEFLKMAKEANSSDTRDLLDKFGAPLKKKEN
jgi:hypothetical protein